ncbi:hypothetical protein AM500_04825 [Bacillus sp. FJAT-18017]|uniref:YveK family protein n=1 Tax=Bacillus sp. FJAT-18017 TaxID=1705566 RepID=UPI0006AF36EF|nr:Wzz/FepE/Etk N-terminal domain-containing protein [Bacillus sp. FJAT-18017]ALC89187.1 hypothetical protein AM500_04825 [Bacillus sp. FJAT-18017]
MEETISLKELLATLRKRLSLIVITTLAAVLIAGIASYFFMTPIYQASSQILVNQEKKDAAAYNAGDIQTNLQLINTYKGIIVGHAILDLVIDEMNLDMSYETLKSKISVSTEQDSQLMNIVVQDEDPKRAADIANKTAVVFQKEIPGIMSVDNVSILAKATVQDGQAPVKPQPLLNIAIALVVGLMAGVGIAFLLEYFDNTIKTEQDVEKLLELPVLGSIPVFDEPTSKQQRTERKSRA